jgi:large subunit ribosomal protein L2
VLAPRELKVGDTFTVSEGAKIEIGNRLPLLRIPIGTFVYNVEIQPGGGARLARSAGNYAEVVAQDAGYTHLKMPSGEVRKVVDRAWASVGGVSNEEHKLVSVGKAGRSRWMGRRPTVRGSAMSPVDHPYGGGEGRGGRGHRRARSIFGKPVGKGQRSRRAGKYSDALVVERRRVGKKR